MARQPGGAAPPPTGQGSVTAEEEWRGFVRAIGSTRLAGVLFQAARTMGDAVFVTDADGRISWVNDRFSRFTGCGLDQVVGRRRAELFRGAPTPQGERVAAALATLDQVSAEFPTQDGTGATRWIALSAFPILEKDGRASGLIGLERDVTADREALNRRHQELLRAESLTAALEHEKRLLSLVIGTIPHMVWWKGPDLRFTGCNAAYLRRRGLRSAGVIGLLEQQLGVDDELGTRLAELEGSVLDTGIPLQDVKLTLEEPPGTFQISVQPCLDSGEITGVVGVGADVTHATELERQLAQANRLEAIGQLAAGIAHEINTPVQYASDNTRFVADSVTDILAGVRHVQRLLSDDAVPDAALRERIRGVLDALDLGFVSEEVPSALAQSLEGLSRVTQIVRAMKDFSHPGQDRTEADLNRLVTSTVQVSRNEWKYVAELELDLDPTLGVVSCFEGDLKQVVLNIVVNAAHAIDERRRLQGQDALGHIVVATRLVGDQARITVTDDGIGMDETVLPRVFEPFFTTKEVGRGTGQGLTLARTAVKKHGGRIEITSSPGAGSTFAIVLPVREPAGCDEADPAPAASARSPRVAAVSAGAAGPAQTAGAGAAGPAQTAGAAGGAVAGPERRRQR